MASIYISFFKLKALDLTMIYIWDKIGFIVSDIKELSSFCIHIHICFQFHVLQFYGVYREIFYHHALKPQRLKNTDGLFTMADSNSLLSA